MKLKKVNLTFSYQRALCLALLLHVIVLTLLIVSFHPQSKQPIVHKANKVIHAVAVDNAEVQKIVKQLKDEQQQKQDAQIAEQKRLDQQAAAAKKQRIAEEHRLEKLKKEQAMAKKTLLSEQKRQQAEIEKLKQQHKQELKQLNDAKKATETAEKALRAEQEKLKKQKAAQAKALALQQSIEAKNHAKNQQRSRALAGIVDKYKALILEDIARQWLVPQGTSNTVSCQLNISLAPGGNVLEVQVVKSSGDSILDRSAVAAVYKASPLPVPEDSAAFNAFRQFNLTVKPEGYLQGIS